MKTDVKHRSLLNMRMIVDIALHWLLNCRRSGQYLVALNWINGSWPGVDRDLNIRS